MKFHLSHVAPELTRQHICQALNQYYICLEWLHFKYRAVEITVANCVQTPCTAIYMSRKQTVVVTSSGDWAQQSQAIVFFRSNPALAPWRRNKSWSHLTILWSHQIQPSAQCSHFHFSFSGISRSKHEPSCFRSAFMLWITQSVMALTGKKGSDQSHWIIKSNTSIFP